MAVAAEGNGNAVNFEKKMRELVHAYLADPRQPNIIGFVDELFRVASEHGSVGGAFAGDGKLRFYLQCDRGSEICQDPAACVVKLAAARSILRMICARLAALCQELLKSAVSVYGDRTVIQYPSTDTKRWNVSFCNTPERQEFSLEPLEREDVARDGNRVVSAPAT
jgi:hypothetical protein